MTAMNWVDSARSRLGGMSLDVKLGVRMLVKFPGLTVAGGLALAVAIAIGAGYHDLVGTILHARIPLPEGDRIVTIDTHDTLTNQPEARVARDFLEWRRELRTLEDLGAYRSDVRNLIAGDAVPQAIQVAELTAAAFRVARVPPALGRGLLDSDERPGAPPVVVLGYEVWQRILGGRPEAVGSTVKLGNTTATLIGVMPQGFAYPISHDAWTPLPLRASYGALDGDAITVIGRLAPGVTTDRANAELRVIAERTSKALPASHAHLRPRVIRLGAQDEIGSTTVARVAMLNLPVLIVLSIACLTVGTLVYARTATRQGEIAVRSALGASRARIVGQLFLEALVLASVAAAVGLIAADQALKWGTERLGDAPFWMRGGLSLSTILYAAGLAAISAMLLSVLPALRATRARVQSHLANQGTGGATLRFGRVWTGAMIAQVALTASGIPLAMETANQTIRKVNIRRAFPSRDYLVARIDLERSFDENATTFEERRTRAFAALEERLAREPGVVAITFAGRAAGSQGRSGSAEVERAPGVKAFDAGVLTSHVGPGFFETFDRPIVAGRALHGGDSHANARTVIVNEAFARRFARDSGGGSPVGARLRHGASEPWFEIVGVVRDFNLDPDDEGHEAPFVFHAATPGALSPLDLKVRMRGSPAALAARLPFIAAEIDGGLFVRDAQPMEDWIRQRDDHLIVTAGSLGAVTVLVLLLSAMGIFSLMSVSVSRRTREIGLRMALGAHPRRVLAGILSRAVMLMGSGILAGAAFVLLCLVLGMGPTSRPADDIPLFAGYLAVTAAIMLAACLLACIGPARRALGINPTEALRDA